MYPANGSMSSYPYQRTQMPSTHYYHPSWETAPPQMKDGPAAAGPSFMHGSWPQNYGYPAPMQCPNCCSHAQYPPAYYNFRPPFPHFPSPPPVYGQCCGGYPPHPVNYVPPSHYTTELPRYEYDKTVPREFHCCGCLHHPCHLKEDMHVKIEEQEPEVETKKIESLVPAGANSYTHPILWIPAGHTPNKEPRRVVENEPERQQISPYYVKRPQWQQRPVETEVEEQQESPRVKKLQWQRRPTENDAGEHLESPRVKKAQQSVKTVEQEPNVMYGWLPLEINSIKELLEGGQGKKACGRESKSGDGKHIQDVENKEQNKQFPFPIFWMPYSGQGENDVEGQHVKDAGETPVKEASPPFKIIPMTFEYPETEPEKIKTAVGDDNSGVGSRATEKTSSIKTIPVKQSEESVSEQVKKDEEQKDREKPVTNAKGSGNGQLSSPKKSKLPPICLRVDPPKKKNGNGSSRSPSPPADKKRQESEEPKTGGSKKEIKVTQAVDNASNQSKVELSRKAGEDIEEELKGDVEKKEVEGQQSQEAESKPPEAKKPAKVLSAQEAATIIQSAYRGYDVRRWEPLKKLRQIVKIREEAAEVKKHIEDLESRAGSSMTEKEQATVAETIMKLLLKLDTIQGLPLSFRDVRRAVAKELIMLQEKLDSIINRKSTPVGHTTSTADAPSMVTGQDEGAKGVVDTAEEPSKVSSQLEGSKVIETVDEPSNVSGLDETSGNIIRTAEEFSKISSLVESSVREDKSARPCREDEVLTLNDVSSAQPLTGQDVGTGSEEETLEMCSEETGKPGELHDQIASTPPVPKVADSQTDVEKEESDGCETVQGKRPAESQDQSAGIGTVENTIEQVGMSLGQKVEQLNVLAELSEKGAEEDEHDTSDMEVSSGTALREESIECACSAPVSDLAPAQKDEESTRNAELPEEVGEEGVEEQASEIPSSETFSGNQEKDLSADVKYEDILVIEAESYKQESTDSTSIEAQKVLGAEAAGIDIPILEHSKHGPEEPTVEKHAVAEVGFQVTEVPGALTEEVEKTQQSPQVDVVERESTITSDGNQVIHNEDAHEPVGGDQERTLEGKVPTLDEQTAPHYENLKAQSPGPETKAPQMVTQESKHEEKPSEESKELPEEGQTDKGIIEENEKLREMLERLIASGKEQQNLISSLSGKVKDLEKQLARKKKVKSSKRPRVLVARASCGNGKPSNGSLRGRPMGLAS